MNEAEGLKDHSNPLRAVLSGLIDLLRKTDELTPLRPDLRMEGRTCLVTGASSGLGRAVALELARRGAELILPCRGGIPEVGEELRRQSGNDRIDLLPVDLADLSTVEALVDDLEGRGRSLDVAILNAGVMPARARTTVQGVELMFGVHYLANHLLAARLVERGLLRGDAARGGDRPLSRVIFVSSEAHRSAQAIDFERFGAFVEYGVADGVQWYGHSKLHLSTLVAELVRRLNDEGGPTVSVHSLCPGAVNTRLAREAPLVAKPLLALVMGLFFRKPAKAAEPVIWLACNPAIEGRSGMYLHLMRERRPSALAQDPDNGARLWSLGGELLASLGHPLDAETWSAPPP
jgi:NAD(P)-dependent dehydrogenase (short-subunit alcohol dehydrogenase family)